MNQDGLIRREIRSLTRLEPVCQLHNGRYKAPTNALGGLYRKPDTGQVGCDAKSEQRVAPDACWAGKVPGMGVKDTAGHAIPDDFEFSNYLPYCNTCQIFAAVYRHRSAHHKIAAS